MLMSVDDSNCGIYPSKTLTILAILSYYGGGVNV